MKKVILTLGIALAAFSVNAQDKKPVTTTPPTTNATPVSNADIKFEKLIHDYGTIKQGGNGDCEFLYTNTGKEPLIISNCQGSCGCTVPSCPKEPILPGKTGVIKVHY